MCFRDSIVRGLFHFFSSVFCRISFDFAFAFVVLYFCLIQCFCHLVAKKGFEIKVNEVTYLSCLLSFPLLGPQEKK